MYHQKEIICISHGSSGFGETEKYLGNYFNTLGYEVIFNNYLADNKIEKLYWSNYKDFNDEYNVTLNQLCKIILPNKPIIHIGFSLGGYVGLVNADKFIKNYCFYPGILPMHHSIKNKDFSNTTLFLPEHDNWCTNTHQFIDALDTPMKSITIKNTKHGFMLLNKNRSFDVITYDFPIFVDTNELEQFLFNHNVLTNKYKHQYTTVNLQSDNIAASICLDYIVNEIQLPKEITASE
jgi:esterase/lipase